MFFQVHFPQLKGHFFFSQLFPLRFSASERVMLGQAAILENHPVAGVFFWIGVMMKDFSDSSGRFYTENCGYPAIGRDLALGDT